MDKKNDLLELQQVFAGLSTIPLHRLVQETKRRLAKAKSDGNGILQTQAKGCLDIRVSQACLDRALNLLNTLFVVLEQRGFSIEVKEGKNSAKPLTCLKLAGEEIQIHIEEKLDRTEHVLTEAEKKNWLGRRLFLADMAGIPRTGTSIFGNRPSGIMTPLGSWNSRLIIYNPPVRGKTGQIVRAGNLRAYYQTSPITSLNLLPI